MTAARTGHLRSPLYRKWEAALDRRQQLARDLFKQYSGKRIEIGGVSHPVPIPLALCTQIAISFRNPRLSAMKIFRMACESYRKEMLGTPKPFKSRTEVIWGGIHFVSRSIQPFHDAVQKAIFKLMSEHSQNR